MTDEEGGGGEIDTHNVYVDKDRAFVSVRVNPRLYRKHVIMGAADDLLHKEKRMYLIIDGDPESEVVVKFIPKEPMSKEELLKVAYAFNSLLVMMSGKG